MPIFPLLPGTLLGRQRASFMAALDAGHRGPPWGPPFGTQAGGGPGHIPPPPGHINTQQPQNGDDHHQEKELAASKLKKPVTESKEMSCLKALINSPLEQASVVNHLTIDCSGVDGDSGGDEKASSGEAYKERLRVPAGKVWIVWWRSKAEELK